MKRTALILLYLLPVLAFSCTDYTPEDPDPEKCHAGEEWDGEKCVPSGCTLNIHCDDGNFCTGLETCASDGTCTPGVLVECVGAFPCIDGDCNEKEDRCDYPLNHEACPPGQVCDPGAGCVTGTPCTDAEQCPERFCFLERLCENDVCTWGLPRDCTDAFQCTEDKCNEARDECDHIPRNTFCQSADPCQLGRCDPDIGCIFEPLQGPPEICDGIDNDCDGLVDERRFDETAGSICACMTPCQNQSECPSSPGSNPQCVQIDEVGSFCVATCDMNGNCDSTDQGVAMSCVTLEWEGLVTQSCMCQADACPQYCADDRECFVYGLTDCLDGRCTSGCLDDAHCPDPYICDPNLGHCSCPLDPGASCLACVFSADCEEMGLDTACYYMDRGVPYSECKIHCYPETPCPYMSGQELYCHQSTLCACRPPYATCEDCVAGENVCEPYRMQCSQVATIEHPPVPMCTAPCRDVHDCPEGWLCQNTGDSLRCVDPYCLGCFQPMCDPRDSSSCDPFGYELWCVDPMGTNDGVCTKTCNDSRDCPPGWMCANGQCGCY